MRGALAVGFVAAAVLTGAARAGAWTLDGGQLQMFSGTTLSRATHGFDAAGRPSDAVLFRKLFVQNRVEYGLTDAVTLFVSPEYVVADSYAAGGSPTHARTGAVEAGGRILLLSRIGMLSIQASGKTAGAFDMSVSAGKAYGSQVELRLLYGNSFKLFGRDGFYDVEAAERWIRRPRPNEMTVDATAGLWVRRATLAMVQSFNTVSGSGAKPPYAYYRMHKLELSVVERLTANWSLQLGGFLSPAGQHVVKEQGLVTGIWYRF